ncbi:MAG: copper chaperone PCu(A)C [Actinomycetota bacterium]
MLGMGSLPRARQHGARRHAIARAVAAAAVLAAGGTAVAGCQPAAGSVGQIRVGSAAVPEPVIAGITNAYLVIQNRGSADRLLAVSTSDGGRVTFRAPAAAGSARMRTVPDIRVPAGATLRLVPNGYHLSITGAGPMHGGTEINLTLVFAKAGTITVPAMVTDPQTGGGSYFLS